jgi:glucose-1-phosphate thymidylyltransferase
MKICAMLLKIRDIALVVNPQDRENFEKLFGDGLL